MNLIFLGAPGSGKGTQSGLLKQELGIPQISTGDILRAAVKNKTAMGLKAQECMKTGKLVPDEIVIGIINERLKSDDCKKGYILDGFPRTIAQAEALKKILEVNKSQIDCVINLKVEEKELINRLSGRRNCKNCGASYHVKFSPSKKEGKCDACGGELIQREDDKEETIKSRLKIYKDQTEPLISYYEKEGLLENIEGVGDTQHILKKIKAVL